MNIEVLSNKVILKRIELEVKTAGGLILGSEVEKERETAFGKVVAVGEGRMEDGVFVPTKVKVGDIVSFKENLPRKVYYLGESFDIIREGDLDFISRDKNVTEKEYELAGYEYDQNVAKQF